VILIILVVVAGALFAVERIWPANGLPKVRAWWPRVIFVNAIQMGIVLVAGFTWDRWLQSFSLVKLHDIWPSHAFFQAILAYFISTFVYYWWHRWRHESAFFWRLCHQLHHSPARIELVTSFYKHPVEILLNSILSAAIVYLLLGCSVSAGAYYTLLTALAEFFYHWNVHTPHWLGRLIQRPESHRVHHKYRHHTQNFADLPLWDMLFGTYENPHQAPSRCGYEDWREDRFEDHLAFRDVHAPGAESREPLHLLPTCIGCGKRWACTESRLRTEAEAAKTSQPIE
jgi:sterol desaturase/sphingolipid hydroxylase (fatty acid hydroxylase superfamily)